VVGCIVAESIDQAFPVVNKPSEELDGITVESSKPAASSSKVLDESMVICSKEVKPALCGISRIWVHHGHRRKGIATRLMDAVCLNFIFGCALSPQQIAFTAPTADGKKFFEKYTKTLNFLVYKK
jgi:N-acetyltransferase